MAITQYHPEVQDRLFSFLEIQYDKASQRWAVWLIPWTLQGFATEPLLPGQSIPVGCTGFQVEYDGEVWIERKSAEKLRTHRDLSKWAVRPFFHSFESAQRKAMHWLNHNRRDLVEACIKETRESLGYRARLASRVDEHGAV